LRIGHFGTRVFHKGWASFEKLALRFAKDPRYAFYQLGSTDGAASIPGNVRYVPVKVSREHPDAMVEAVAEHGIDAAMIWSAWPETFCYTAHEALAGGAFLLTHPGTGNVARLAAQHAPTQGCVLEDEAALHALLQDGGLVELLAAASRRRGVLVAEGGTAAWALRSVDGQRALRSGGAKSAVDHPSGATTDAVVTVPALEASHG
jgi:hypothetical protein